MSASVIESLKQRVGTLESAVLTGDGQAGGSLTTRVATAEETIKTVAVDAKEAKAAALAATEALAEFRGASKTHHLWLGLAIAVMNIALVAASLYVAIKAGG